MRRLVLAISMLGSFGCAEDPQLPAAGEACDGNGECAEGLRCVHLVCADDRGPSIRLIAPVHLQAFAGEVSSLSIDVTVTDASDGDQVEVIVDPGAQDPHRELIATSLGPNGAQVSLPAPLAVGPHHVRARVVDAAGQPYPNPSATAESVLFVRDPDIPDTPQVAIVWPPAGYEHRIGNPLELEVAVLPGSFTFVQNDDDCPPLPNCEPELAPECEAACGPVSREGHTKLYVEPNYPACLLDEPIGCNGNYITLLRPGDLVDLFDAHQIRGAVETNYLGDPRDVRLSAALSYGYHDPYPSKANVIHETITLKLVE